MKNLVKKSLLAALILRGCLPSALLAQKADPAPFAATINTSELRNHLVILTSDSLEGRETGMPGNQKAAEYLAQQMEKLGLPKVVDNKSYFQRMVYTNEAWNNISMTVNEQSYRHLFNFYAYPATNPSVSGNKMEASEVIFLGYGIDDERYSDYKKHDVKGKIILINQGEPMKGDSISLVTKTRNVSSWSVDIRRKLKVAQEKGVKAVLIIDSELSRSVQEGRRFFSRNIMATSNRPMVNTPIAFLFRPM
ncbi:MAG: hypothetical protein HC817_11065 [Saprospiraceae bacterium]|nr:hypothetical protein [Saprospiraceae bacterium]